MTNRVRRLLVGCAMVAFGISHQVVAQDDADDVAEKVDEIVQEAQRNGDQQAGEPEVRQEVLPEGDADGDGEDPKAKFNRAVVTPEDDALISELMVLEKLRREAYDGHGQQSLESARRMMLEGNHMGAVSQYQQVLDYLGNRPANDDARKEAEEGIAEAYLREAKQLYKRKDYEQAKQMAEKALQMGHSQAARTLEQIPREAPPPGDPTRYLSRPNEQAYKDRQDDIRRRLRRARQYFVTSEFDSAMEECEIVLHMYPSDVEAIELRRRISERLNEVSMGEFAATRATMIQQVTDTWTPRIYAQNSPQLPKITTDRNSPKRPTGSPGSKQTDSQIVNQKLRTIILPEVSFRPPATIIDAIDFFKQASSDYDNPETPIEQRGVNLVLKLLDLTPDAGAVSDDPFAAPAGGGAGGVPVIPAMTARNISLFDALRLVCEVTGMKFRVSGTIVMIVPLNEADKELESRSYNVLPSFVERITTLSGELPKTAAGGAGGFMPVTPMGTTTEEDDYKRFFGQMGVKWPIGSSITYLMGRLRVTNTDDQLAAFEQVLSELNVTEKLVEIETRFVEVSQEDLNSLGFEWLINGDYSFDAGGVARKLLGLKNYTSGQLMSDDGSLLFSDPAATIPLIGRVPYGNTYQQGYTAAHPGFPVLPHQFAAGNTLSPTYPKHNMSINAIDGQNYGLRNRYLNTENNAIVGQNPAINDQFMRLNAFIGGADVSMILHMLSQQTDTDLLSAPKVTVSPDQEAIMKVVTEYIYPSEFNVQISQQGTSGVGYGGGSTGEPLAIVEPQNFTMREVGVILQVIPKLSEDGQMITLSLRPQVVSEPVWKNYGTRIPRQTVVPGGVVGGILQGDELVTEYIELPMEQPFFNVRSIETQLTINNGATVVMGGLITESRVTIEDKVPLLGDIPYLGRLFRSRAEKTNKRNLLIFVTARTLGTDGRILLGTGGDALMAQGAPPQPPPAALPDAQ